MFGPTKNMSGPNRLREYKGYTVDFRVQEFRKIPLDGPHEFIDFDSPEGQEILWQMHEEAIKRANRTVNNFRKSLDRAEKRIKRELDKRSCQ